MKTERFKSFSPYRPDLGIERSIEAREKKLGFPNNSITTFHLEYFEIIYFLIFKKLFFKSVHQNNLKKILI